MLSENFDSTPIGQIPAGWERAIAVGPPTQIVWYVDNVSPNPPDSGTQAIGLSGTASQSDVRLDSPPIAIQTATAQLSFCGIYRLEGALDGVALEISLAGGPFTDILAASGSFVTGGYLGKLVGDSPLRGRWAWTQISGNWITTKVNLPAAAAGKTIRLRWRFASNTGGVSSGYVVDTVKVTDGYLCTNACMPSRLVERVQLTRDATTKDIIASVSLTNEGGTTATNVQLTEAVLGAATGTTLPQSLSNIGPGAVVSTTIRFPAAVGGAGERSVIRLAGTYGNGNTFGSTSRITLPN